MEQTNRTAVDLIIYVHMSHGVPKLHKVTSFWKVGFKSHKSWKSVNNAVILTLSKSEHHWYTAWMVTNTQWSQGCRTDVTSYIICKWDWSARNKLGGFRFTEWQNTCTGYQGWNEVFLRLKRCPLYCISWVENVRLF